MDLSTLKRSFLRESVLLELNRAPAPTITALAERVGASRPSVSRTLSRLREAGHVESGDAGLQLTEMGRAMVNDIDRRASERLRAASRQVNHNIGIMASLGSTSMPAEHARDIIGAATGISERARMALGGRAARDALSAMTSPAIAPPLPSQESLASLTHALGGIDAKAVVESINNQASTAALTPGLTTGVAEAFAAAQRTAAQFASMAATEQLAKSLSWQTPALAAIESMVGLQDAYRRQFESLQSLIPSIVQQVGAVRSIAESATGVIGSLYRQPGWNDFLSRLPDLQRMIRRAAQAEEGRRRLAAAGFEYTEDIWVVSFFIELAGTDPLKRVDITEELRAFTDDPGFEPLLVDLLDRHPLLERRKRAVQEGLEAHRQGRYYASTATLLPAMEGILTDLLTLKNVIRLNGRKFFTVPLEGETSQEVTGLWKKQSYAAKHKLISTAMANYLAGTLNGRRNGILHGSDVDYGDPVQGGAEQSVHAILTLYVAAWTFLQVVGDKVEETSSP